jgi:predicted hotdog family 3-hydroxylacyl-ACP dehydratase
VSDLPVSALPPVAGLVPHAPPMLAVDELLECAPGRALARLVVRDGLFSRAGRVDAIVTFEYMAQVVAACLGHEALRQGEGVRVGMVIACRRLNIEQPFVAVGDELLLRVERVRGSDHVSHFDAETRTPAGALVSRVTLTLIHGERPPA